MEIQLAICLQLLHTMQSKYFTCKNYKNYKNYYNKINKTSRKN